VQTEEYCISLNSVRENYFFGIFREYVYAKLKNIHQLFTTYLAPYLNPEWLKYCPHPSTNKEIG
jgi:hypothetical protein